MGDIYKKYNLHELFCEQQSVVHPGVFTFLLHLCFSSITCYLPFGPVGCEMLEKERGTTGQGKVKEQEHTIFQGKLQRYLQPGDLFSTSTLHNTLSKPLAPNFSMLSEGGR